MKHTVRRVESALPMPRLKKIPLSAISLPPAAAADAASLSLLMESIRRHGLLQPIGVRRKRGFPIRYELLFGARRLLACRALFLPSVPCLVFPDRRESALLSLCENFQRVAPDSEAVFAAARRLGLTPQTLCTRLPIPCPEEQKRAAPREFSLFNDEADPPEKAAAPRSRGILRDARLIANSIDRAVCAGKSAGLIVEVQKVEREREICYHIRLPLQKGGTITAFSSEPTRIA